MNSFLNTALFGIILTIIAYILAYFITEKVRSDYLNITLVSGVIVVLFLIVTKIPIESFNIGGNYFTALIGPFTVAFAIPLYMNLDVIKRNLFPIIIGVLTGIITTVGSVLIFGKFLGIDSNIINSMTTKSVTTAITIELAQEIGAIVPMAVLMVVLTGFFGIIVIPIILEKLNIKTDLAKGLTFGVISHVMGSSEAGKINPDLSAYGSVGMSLVCLIAPVIIPLMIMIFG